MYLRNGIDGQKNVIYIKDITLIKYDVKFFENYLYG